MSSNDRVIRRTSDPAEDRRLAVGAVRRTTASLRSAARASRAMIGFAATDARLRRNLEVVTTAARELREVEEWLEAAVRAAVVEGADDDAIRRALA